jgi:hypothetical protein
MIALHTPSALALALALTGCMGSRECKQTCWPHPVREYSQTFGVAACGCVTEPQRPVVAASPVASASAAPVATAAPITPAYSTWETRGSDGF